MKVSRVLRISGKKEPDDMPSGLEFRTIFDAAWYIRTYPEVAGYKDGPLNHYLRVGAYQGHEPNAYFDTPYYRMKAANVGQKFDNALVHYLSYGGAMGLSPCPYFDPAWYRRQNPDVNDSGIDPYVHFLNNGIFEGRDPNQLFHTQWYMAKYGQSEIILETPLLHYISIGERKGLLPSRFFDPSAYLECNPDVKASGTPPLQHFLNFGMSEKRKLNRSGTLFRSVMTSQIACVKRPIQSDEMALFVTHSADGSIKPHVRYHIESLIKNGVGVVLIAACEIPNVDVDDLLLQSLSGMFVRENAGFDFGAWAHVWQLHPEVRSSEIIYFVNDSIVGPLDPTAFSKMLSRVRNSNSDIVGLVDNYERYRHLQSFFIAIKSIAIKSRAFQSFFSSIENFDDKQDVIDLYELPFFSQMIAAGLKCETLFPAPSDAQINRTIYHWRQLIADGFPYIKVTTLRDRYPGVDIEGWENAAARGGYDKHLVGHLANPREKEPYFDANFYLAAYPEVAQAGWQAWEHFDKHGRAEGRLTHLPGLSDLKAAVSAANDRPYVLIISHEAGKSGAPILVYNIAKCLARKVNPVVIFLGAGDLISSCREAGLVCIGPAHVRDFPGLAHYMITEIVSACSPEYAIVNSVESRRVLPALSANNIATVTLIHEFAAYIRPESAFAETVIWSGATVFSTPLTRDNAIQCDARLAAQNFPIIPQGLCDVPSTTGVSTDRESRDRIGRLVKPASYEGLIVLGVGNVEYRKGVDLFITCANKLMEKYPNLPVRFVWAGKGYMPLEHASYSSFLADQNERYGQGTRVHFLGEVQDVNFVYGMADILLLPSRLDPLPNVTIEALAMGLPVICFDRASGIAPIFEEEGLFEDLVAPYLDVDGMVDRLARLLTRPELREALSERCVALARRRFDMNAYVDELADQAQLLLPRTQQEKLDIKDILSRDVIDHDYYRRDAPHGRNPDYLVCEYVRSWARNIDCRKLFPGFHPGIYREKRMTGSELSDPLAHYLRAGGPAGSWNCRVIRPSIKSGNEKTQARPRCALHIHCFYPEMLPDIVKRITLNRLQPDLLISIPQTIDSEELTEAVQRYEGSVKIKKVPNLGRDIAPFFVAFKEEIKSDYQYIGHVHTKKSKDVDYQPQITQWREFLFENMLGGVHPMIDILIDELMRDPTLGIAFPDDPHAIGWDANREHAQAIWSRISRKELPTSFSFPIGTMFWARYEALAPLFKLDLEWPDFPPEPLPYDGTMLHALERLIGLVVEEAGYSIATTQCREITRTV